MNVSGMWSGQYSYEAVSDSQVTFQAELKQFGAVVEGQTTETNIFGENTTQILIAHIFG
jgi:hypothetical protein